MYYKNVNERSLRQANDVQMRFGIFRKRKEEIIREFLFVCLFVSLVKWSNVSQVMKSWVAFSL